MTVTFNKDHDNPSDSQLIIIVTGTPEGIAQAIKDIQIGTIDWPAEYKPIQGTRIASGTVSSVITPIWNGKAY